LPALQSNTDIHMFMHHRVCPSKTTVCFVHFIPAANAVLSAFRHCVFVQFV